MRLQYVYSQDQLLTFSEELPVLTDALLNPSKTREKAAEVCFETVNVPALFTSVPACTQQDTPQDGATRAVSIWEGFATQLSVMRWMGPASTSPAISSCCCTRKVSTATPQLSLRLSEPSESEPAPCPSSRRKMRPWGQRVQCTLLDGSTLDAGPARFRALALLFLPHLVGNEGAGLHEVLTFVIHKSDLDLRWTPFANIVFWGSTTLFTLFEAK